MTKRKSERRHPSPGRPAHDNLFLFAHIAASARAYGKTINGICESMKVVDISLGEDGIEFAPVPTATIKRRHYTAKKKLLNYPAMLTDHGGNPASPLRYSWVS